MPRLYRNFAPAHSGVNRRPGRLALVFLLAAGLLAACEDQQQDKTERSRPEVGITQPDLRVETIPPGGNIWSDYLSGMHAESEMDFAKAAGHLDGVLKKIPDAEVILMNSFQLHVLEGEWDKALKLAPKVVELEDPLPVARLLLALNEIKNGRFDKAEEQFKKLPQDPVRAIAEPVLTAWVKFGQDDTTAARRSLARLRASTRLSDMVSYQEALLFIADGKTDAAEKALRSMFSADGQASFQAVDTLGRLYESQGKADEATAIYKTYNDRLAQSQDFYTRVKAVEKGEKHVLEPVTPTRGVAEVLLDIAQIFDIQAGRAPRDELRVAQYSVGLQYAQLALFMESDYQVARTEIAEIYDALEKFEKANAYYAEVAKTDHALKWRASMRFARNLAQLDQMKPAVRRLKELDQKDPTRIDVPWMLGGIYQDKEMFKEASAAYTQAIERLDEINPSHWVLFYSRGIAFERTKQWPKAEADFEKALELQPNQPFVLNYLGYSWVDRGEHLTKARKMIEEAVAQRPRDGMIVDSLGWVLYRLGEYVEAVEHLERAVNLMPHDPTINDHLGDAYWRVGRRIEAKFQWRRALAQKDTGMVEDGFEKTVKAKIENGLTVENKKPAGMAN